MYWDRVSDPGPGAGSWARGARSVLPAYLPDRLGAERLPLPAPGEIDRAVSRRDQLVRHQVAAAGDRLGGDRIEEVGAASRCRAELGERLEHRRPAEGLAEGARGGAH